MTKSHLFLEDTPGCPGVPNLLSPATPAEGQADDPVLHCFVQDLSQLLHNILEHSLTPRRPIQEAYATLRVLLSAALACEDSPLSNRLACSIHGKYNMPLLHLQAKVGPPI